MFYLLAEHPRGHSTVSCQLDRYPRGPFISFCLLEGHLNVILIIFFPAETYPRGHFAAFRVPAGNPRGNYCFISAARATTWAHHNVLSIAKGTLEGTWSHFICQQGTTEGQKCYPGGHFIAFYLLERHSRGHFERVGGFNWVS